MQQQSASSTSTTPAFSLATLASVVCGVAILVALAAMKVRGRGAATATAHFEPLPTASEHVVELEQVDLGM